MPADAKLIDLADQVPHRLEAGVAEFQHLVAILTDEVVVLPVTVGPLVLGVFPTKLMAHNEIALDQQLEGVVDGSPADGDILFDEPGIQFVGVKVALDGIHLVKDRESFGRVALFALPEKRLENASNLVLLRRRGLHRDRG